jgi:hypothetical protein
MNSCEAQLLGAIRDDRTIASQSCQRGTITPSQHNTVNFDRAAKEQRAIDDPTYACRVAAADIDRDLVPDDIDQCLGTPPLTATLANGCTNPALVPGPDPDEMARLRANEVFMHDPECTAMDMRFTPRDVRFISEKTLGFRPIEAPPPSCDASIDAPVGCDIIYEFDGTALLQDGSSASYHFVFTEADAADFHCLRYLFLNPSDPGDRGRLASADVVDLLYTFRAMNGSGAHSYWTHPAHAGREPQ